MESLYISHVAAHIPKSRGFRLEEVSQFFKPLENAQDLENVGDIEYPNRSPQVWKRGH